MPDDNGGNAGNTAQGGTGNTTTDSGQSGDGAAYTAPQTQADLDRIVGERLARERSKFADYEDLKAKAKAHDEAVAAGQSETEREKTARAKAEDRAASAEGQLARFKVAAAKGVPEELLKGSTEEELNAHADQLIAFRGGEQGGQGGQGGGTRPPSFDGGARSTADGKTDMNGLIRRAAGVSR